MPSFHMLCPVGTDDVVQMDHGPMSVVYQDPLRGDRAPPWPVIHSRHTTWRYLCTRQCVVERCIILRRDRGSVDPRARRRLNGFDRHWSEVADGVSPSNVLARPAAPTGGYESNRAGPRPCPTLSYRCATHPGSTAKKIFYIRDRRTPDISLSIEISIRSSLFARLRLTHSAATLCGRPLTSSTRY